MCLNSGENDNRQNFNLKNYFTREKIDKGENDRGYYHRCCANVNIYLHSQKLCLKFINIQFSIGYNFNLN